jgi:hypothetical protein
MLVAFFLITIDSVIPTSNISRNSNTETSSNQLKGDLQNLLLDDDGAGIQTIYFYVHFWALFISTHSFYV